MKPIKYPFYFGANFEIIRRAKLLRDNMTVTKKVLWEKLQAKRLNNVRFRAQHPIDRFIVDFFCPSKLLVIELDGDVHNNKDVSERDEGREIELKKLGLKIIRFTNEEVMSDINIVISKIVSECLSG